MIVGACFFLHNFGCFLGCFVGLGCGFGWCWLWCELFCLTNVPVAMLVVVVVGVRACIVWLLWGFGRLCFVFYVWICGCVVCIVKYA